jgi:hypothetical protein
MKICPKCGKTYSDPSLNFCLEDGSVLNPSGQTGGSFVPPETVMINQPRPTSQNPPFQGQTANQSWNAPVPAPPAKKGSKAWLWVVGILGAVVVLCGGGLGGLILLGSMAEDEPKWNANFGENTAYNTASNTNTASNKTTDTRTNITEIDLAAWVRDNSQYGTTVYRGGEFFMSAKKSNFYYVLVAPATYKSSDATTKVRLRNAEGGDNSLGYGLIVNSNPVPLIKDYAFLINTKTLKYRVVIHSPGKEQTVVNWKSSPAIKGGDQENVLEVRDEDGKFHFFINGELVETLSSSDSYKNGVPGLYVGGTSPIAFSKLEIRK